MDAGAEPIHFRVGDGDPHDRLDKLVVHLLERAGRAASRAAVQRWIAEDWPFRAWTYGGERHGRAPEG